MTDQLPLPDPYPVTPVNLTRPIAARTPGSKSLTNRALIMAALTGEEIILANPLTSEDTEVARAALSQLGVTIVESQVFGNGWIVSGANLRAPETAPRLDLGNAGTAMRFLAAVLCARGIPCILDGTPRMRERPMDDLIQALRDLGGDVSSELGTGCPPIVIGPGGLEGGATTVSGQVSSQFFSALMIAAPLARRDVTIHIRDELLSSPYVEMTAQLLNDFGIEARVGQNEIHIPAGQGYRLPTVQQPQVSAPESLTVSFNVIAIEPDASAATYPLGLAVLHGTIAAVKGLGEASLQGDVRFLDYLGEMGCKIVRTREGMGITQVPPLGQLRPLTADLRAIPDAAMTLVTLLAVVPGHSTLTGLRNLAFKECDRLSALEAELNSLGCRVTVREDRDGFEIEGVEAASLNASRPLRTYKDHRMAMCLAILGTITPGGVQILDPHCVEKTYPTFWRDLGDWIRQGTGNTEFTE